MHLIEQHSGRTLSGGQGWRERVNATGGNDLLRRSIADCDGRRVKPRLRSLTGVR
ncbi:hypothetical protein GLE_1435 [Lysobacter enzymogenes]|uniref:Uncharacterized protein n=1 Tax=Lysobacter enzymogenes TaxID=69 RepID=A0A0S2DEK8_LYSEN|nr:hypothetical protein GLE_1435 [Lysobacter enzymogenes]